MFCEYGCNQEAKFVLKNGKHCCSKHHGSCPTHRGKISKAHLNGKCYTSQLIKKHEFICNYCKETFFKSTRNKNDHLRNCKKNPDNTVTRICEKCKNEFKTFKWMLNRFCSRSCANGHAHSQEWKEKISKGLHNRKLLTLTCKKCGLIYTGIYKKQMCPNLCDNKKYKFKCQICNLEYESYSSQKACPNKCGYKNSGGLRIGGGRCKVYEYISPIAGLIKINKDEIRLAKVFDQLQLDWKRNTKGFETAGCRKPGCSIGTGRCALAGKLYRIQCSVIFSTRPGPCLTP